MTNHELFPDNVFFPNDQLPMFLMALVIGAVTGILRDFLTLRRHMFGENRVMDFLCEFVTVLFSYAVLFLCALNENHGIIRWYHAGSDALGYALYRKSVSQVVCRVLDAAAHLLGKLFHSVFSAVAFPLKKLAHAAEKVYVARRKQAEMRAGQRLYTRTKREFCHSAARGFDLVTAKEERKEWKKRTEVKSKRLPSLPLSFF